MRLAALAVVMAAGSLVTPAATGTPATGQEGATRVAHSLPADSMARARPDVAAPFSDGRGTAGALGATVLPDIFASGFEAGTTCDWSAVAPVPSTCSDFILDDCETDVDCGGGQCAACPNNAGCLVNNDCASGLCDVDTCVECLSAVDCASGGSACWTPTCTSGACGLEASPQGTSCSDNGGSMCDGFGSCVQCLAAEDCPSSSTLCQTPTCSAGFCDSVPAPEGSFCSDSGGSLCDGFGSCVECLTANDCPATGNECMEATCDAGVCGVVAVPQDVPCTGGVCDGAGACVPL